VSSSAVEDLANEVQWRRAYDEINDFEHSLAEEGMVVINSGCTCRRGAANDASSGRDDHSNRGSSPQRTGRNREKRPQYKQAVSDIAAALTGGTACALGT